ncbi:hypothetical protein [Spirosoma sp. KUDC1026]|uniref:hypothetical protein n=1 Tax=Spirosoma sp. KUDC1026 TaxID=2745947 RepID=UPI00159BE007|nr:hypothetical protein [Spirosoma sp. KUDC1026]QKZ12080.1 hypothetical protein HU175_05320 [Spirosoma sp. KUDC1026]
MKKYICLNHGECNWADEKPPREFSLPEGEENVCPNCESTNLKEVIPPGPPRGRIALIASALVLLAAIAWLIWFQSQPPLKLNAEMNCETGLITLTSTGGNEEPITFSADGLSLGQENNTFKVPRNRRKGSTFTFHAEQSGNTVNTEYTTDCPVKKLHYPPGPKEEETSQTTVRPAATWSKINGSDFCIDDCVVEYTEQDNLGHTRVRRVSNYAKCCPAEN